MVELVEGESGHKESIPWLSISDDSKGKEPRGETDRSAIPRMEGPDRP